MIHFSDNPHESQRLSEGWTTTRQTGKKGNWQVAELRVSLFRGVRVGMEGEDQELVLCPRNYLIFFHRILVHIYAPIYDLRKKDFLF